MNDSLIFSHTHVDEETERLIEIEVDPRAERAAKLWLLDVAPLVEKVCDDWAETAFQAHADIRDRWEEHYKPILLWRFYGYLANELEMVAEGHRSVFFRNHGGDRP